MTMNCNIAEDLLPLYLDNACSDDSRHLLEEHLKSCSACREKLARMGREDLFAEIQTSPDDISMAEYAKKVKRHRFRIAVLVGCFTIVAAMLLSLVYLTVRDMYHLANPTIHEVEPGIHNLTAEDLETTAEDVGSYVFFTNYKQIAVTVRQEGDFDGTIKLWSAEYPEDFILTGDVSQEDSTCIFTGLSSSYRYKVTCEGLDCATVIVSEGRSVSFWHSLMNVMQELLEMVF